ncbi:acyl-CoA dehydrogenase family protein [Bacillus sp. es.036]|uniref:acyl-CoA dehydrogenase family protein n=1 Tax=Bacillus sp. es.036 TaxID=1761764 RepID=UPI000BF6ED5C|nr:acyl-CoA dehydrogenase family protein [Bacillus sp. es.036]PFG13307.1 alkylation response protein AidB-like acyl-CoA dehydrogenase [Bacillus sp. es.036]
MNHLYHSYLKNNRQKKLLKMANTLADSFSERADAIDKEGRFPFENFEELKNSGYVALTVPAKFGGKAIDLYEFVMLQERIATGDAATALSIGWHLGLMLEMRDEQTWTDDVFERLSRLVMKENALFNRAASEPATGSPTRGGMPETKATEKDGQWIVNGRKSFTSMAPGLQYALVSAQIGDTGQKGFFLIDMNLSGVKIEEKWDTISMRGTRSDDLVLNDVLLPKDALVEGPESPKSKLPKAWLLHIPACYLGVAIAARNEAIAFASTYSPNSLPGPIKEVPEVQRKIGEMELELMRAREMMYSVALRWVSEPEKRSEMGPELAAVKHVATNSAANVVDQAMRIVGARALFKDNPMQRHYRDVRAGLHNPPMDDAVISMLAGNAISHYESS